MSHRGDKHYGLPPRFDPTAGTTVATAPASGTGYWAGAPSSVFDPQSGRFYLYYRLRAPLRQGRGGECRIGESHDGIAFDTIWQAGKDEFGANSIEKGSLIRTPQGRWRLYLSYEVASGYDRNPPTWRVDLLEADSPTKLEAARSRPVIDGPMFGFTFVKDPTVLTVAGEYFVYASVGLPRQHEPADAAGRIRTRGRGWTALFRSPDGVRFDEAKVVMGPDGGGWDGFQRRITSVCRLGPSWLAFFDGATHRADSYDEFCGLAVSSDLETFRVLTVDGPWVTSPFGTRSIRYLDALPVGESMNYYYEFAREDGSHELRHNRVPLSD